MPSNNQRPWSGDRIQIDSDSSHEGICADHRNTPPWVQGYVTSPLLDHYEIYHMGIVSADAKYAVSRVHSPYTHFIASLDGEASLWLGGEHHLLAPGTACLLPKGSSHMDQTLGPGPWRFCYVCYFNPHKGAGFHGLVKPLVTRYDPWPLLHTITALLHECRHHSDAESQRLLLGVVNHLVLRAVEERTADARLLDLWRRVEAAPAESWPLERLEKVAHCHREHLRRLCQRHYGHSPVKQVAFIRMQCAANLLRATNWTLERIANEVGYADAFSLSAAFKHWFKVSPSAYRHEHGSA